MKALNFDKTNYYNSHLFTFSLKTFNSKLTKSFRIIFLVDLEKNIKEYKGISIKDMIANLVKRLSHVVANGMKSSI
jgi:hypothetical protein